MAKKQTETSIPTNVAAEEAVIGTMLTNVEALKRAIKILAPDDFWSNEAASVFDVCTSLNDRHEEVDKESTAGELRVRDILGEIGGEGYLGKLIDAADAVLFSSNVSTIKNFSILRKIIHMGNKLLKDAVVQGADSATMVQEAEAEFNAIKTGMDGMCPRITSLEILTSNPRKYRIRFSNNKDVEISVEDILNPKAVKTAIVNELDFVPALARDWEKFIKSLMVNAKKSPTPPNADKRMEILDVIKDLFDAKGEGREASDLRTGCYAIDEISGEKYYLFQKSAIVTYTKQQLDRKISTAELWLLVSSWGGINKKNGKEISKRIGNDSRTALWALPASVIEEGIFKKGDKIEISKDGEVDVSFL